MFDDFRPDEESSSNPNKNEDSPKSGSLSSVPTWVNTEVVEAGAANGVTYKGSARMTVPPPPPPTYESAARQRMRKRRVRGGNKGGEWAWVIIAVALFGIVIIVSLSLFLFFGSTPDNSEVIPTAAVAELLPTPIDARTDFDPSGLGIGSELILGDGSSIEIRSWDGQGRFTFVMVGLDRRAGETGLSYRTDTIMLISIDPSTQTIGLLSVPRDLYVQVPGYSSLQRVNTPMVYGESRQPGYGPQLMMQTLQLNLGIRVNDYLAVDFQAFIDLVNAIGGIDVENKYTINDPLYPDMNYGYDPFYLAAGQHHLDGTMALKFARTRHGDNDFERARRQQEVLNAIRKRVLQLDMLPTLILQAPNFWESLSDNIYTGMNLQQIIELALYIKDIPAESIKMDVIDSQYIRPYTTSSGASVLIPDRSSIGNLMVEIFGPSYDQ